jgi:integrase/recombinase XerC
MTENQSDRRRKPPRYLREPEVARLEAALAERGHPRDRAMITLFLYAGLRLNELRMLDRDDIEFDDRRIMVRFAKGGKWRRLSLHPKAAETLRAYLDTRRDPDPAFFLSRNRLRLSPRAIERLVDKYVQPLELAKRITPHCLRHTFAVRLYRRSGGDIRLVQRALGHSSIQTTVVYLQLEDSQMFDAMDQL